MPHTSQRQLATPAKPGNETLCRLLAARLVLLLVLFGLAAPCRSAPYISEFLAKNDTGLADEDNSREDWIEIHNPDAVALDLGGYSLTDDASQPDRWIFPPNVSLPAGGYLVVFASGKDRHIAGSPLHTSFSLASGGEYLALSGPNDGAPLSEFAPTFPPQSSNISYGRLGADLAAGFGYFNTPTPGAANNPATAAAEAVRFSLTSRTFSSATLSISLTTLSPTATIRYTTNRTEPNTSSTIYSGTPITISASTRIRARAFEPGRPAGPVGSETFLKIDASAASFSSTLPIIVTTTWGASVPTTNTQVPAHLMVFEPKPETANTARMTNLPDISVPCIVERRGSSTAGAEKYSMKLETQDESGSDRGFPILGMPRDADWVLHAPYSYDPSLMHNDLIYRISNDAGRYAVRTKFVEHFHDTTVAPGTIGGALTGSVDYFGVYSFMEKITRGNDRVDVERLTTADNVAPRVQGGYMFKVDRLDPGESGLTPLSGQSFGGVGEMGLVYPKMVSTDPSLVVTIAQSNYLRGAIGNFVAAVTNTSTFMDPQSGYAAHLDVGAAVDHHLLNVAAKNVDALRLSAYWYKPRYGKLAPGPLWDFDRAQGSTDGRDLLPTTWRGDNGDLGTDFFHYPWYDQLFDDPNFWQAWIDRLHALRTTTLSTANVHALIDLFAGELNPGNGANTPAKRNASRWGGPRGSSSSTPGTNGSYAGEVQWLKNWWAARLSFMDGQFIRPVASSVPSGPVAPGTQVSLTSPSLTRPGSIIYYTTNATDPRPRATSANGGGPVIVTKATLIDEMHPVRAIVPTSATTGGPTGVEWRNLSFDDAAWFANAPGTINGVGYDDATSVGQVSFLPYWNIRWNSVGLVVAPQNDTNTMRTLTAPALAGNQSCYLRLIFSLTQDQRNLITGDTKLILKARYDDGFVAWLNAGTIPVAQANPPFSMPTINYNSGASQVRADADAIVYQDFDLSAAAGQLVIGQNVLAVQGMNAGLSSPDFLFQAKLVISGPLGSNSPTGVAYTGPLTITAPTILTARTFDPATPSDPPSTSSSGAGTVPNGSGWSAPVTLYFFPGAAAASAANLRITEVLYHPLAPTFGEIAAGFDKSNDFDFIRLTNISSGPVDLTGITFAAGVEFTAAANLKNWLPAGESVVIVENSAAFTARYGNAFTVLGEFRGELDDGGETITLNDKNGQLIAQISYDDAGPWPSAADNGHSLLLTGQNAALPASWASSLDPGGSGVATFSAWSDRYQQEFDPMADDDGDEATNLAEYAFGSDPLDDSSRPRPPSFVYGPPTQLGTLRRLATDLYWQIESSPNVQNWQPTASTATNFQQSNELTNTNWSLATPTDRTRYFRIKVSLL